MKKLFIGGLLVIFILLPVVVALIRLPAVSTNLTLLLHLPVHTVPSVKYEVQSDVPGYSLLLTDTSYLDYLTASAGIFGSGAVIDPNVYHKIPLVPNRYTVTAIRFVLSNEKPEFPVSIITGDGITNPPGIIGMGGYTVQDRTLVVTVWLNIRAFQTRSFNKKYAIESMFIRTVFNTIYYAKGLKDALAEHDTLVKALGDISQNLYSGLFPWPFQILSK